VSTGDLVVTGVNQAVYSPTSMTYNASTATAVWTFAQPLPLDNLLVNVNGSGSGAVKDRSGNPLDGALQGSASDFHEAFTVVPGDVNGSAAVNVMDVVKTRMAQFTTTTSANYSPYYDVNGSGAVDIFDTIKVRNGQFTMAPDGLPAPYAFPAASGMLAASGDNPLASSLAGLAGGAQGLAAPSLAGASPSLGAATGQIATADGPAAPTNSSSSSSPDFTVASSTSWATVDGGNSPIYSSSIDVAQEQTLASPTAQLAALDDVLSTWPK
jgi:hypothetical protein